MQIIEIELPPEANLSQMEKTIDATLTAVGLRVSLRGTLKKFPGCIHWHAKNPGQSGTLELTLWPNNTGPGSAFKAVEQPNGFPRSYLNFSECFTDIWQENGNDENTDMPIGRSRSTFAVDIAVPPWLSSRRHVQMNIPVPNRVSVTVNPTFWELFIGSLTLIRYQGARMILHAIFPLVGLFLLVAPFCIGLRPGMCILEVLIGLLAISFTPLITALAIRRNRRNKLAQGPFTYNFDSEGMHTSGAAFAQTIKWPAIPRARLSKRFLFVFISPISAHCFPLKALSEQGVLDEALNIVGQHTDLR